MSNIITPPRVFIDTSHLSNMLRVQRGEGVPNDDGSRAVAYGQIHKWLRSGAATAVFCESLIIEWIRHEDKKRPFRYAQLLDSAACVLEFPPMPGVPLAEALNECSRTHPQLGLPRFEIVRALSVEDPLLIFLSKHDPDMKSTTPAHLDRQRPPRPSLKASVALKVKEYQRLAKLDGSLWQVGVEGDRIAFETTKATQTGKSAARIHRHETLRYWLMKAFPLEAVLRSACPDREPEDLVAELDQARCPGTLLYYRAYDKYVRARDRYDDPHDFVDQTYVPGLAYCDFAMVDKRVREFITQGQRDLRVSTPVVVSDARPLTKAIGRRIAGDDQ